MADKFPTLVAKAGQKSLPVSKIQSKWLRAEYRSLKRHMRLRVTELEHAAAQSQTVAVGFFESLRFNAFARTDEQDQHLIALSGVVSITLLRVFNYLMAHHQVLPWIGSPEPTGYEFEKHDVLNLTRFMNFEGIPGDPVIKDQTRARAARWLYERAIDFIIFHELGHIWNGHTRYLNATYGLTSIDELSLIGDIGPAQLDKQTLEMDADGFAVRELLRRNYTSDGWRDPDLEKLSFEGSTPLVLALLAPYIVFRLFQDSSKLEEAQSFIHPPAPLRMRMMIGYAANLIHVNDIWSKPSLDLAHKTASIAALWGEHIFDLFQNDRSGLKIVANAFGLEGSAYKRMLLANWAAIRPKLGLLKLGGELAGSEL